MSTYFSGWAGNTPFWRPHNWYGGINPETGQSQDWYNTPDVRDFLSETLPGGEWLRFATEQGYGGTGRRAQLANQMYGEAQQGYESAQLSNPNLTFRKYLNTLEGGWLDKALAGLTMSQRGAYHPAMTRIIRQG